MAEGIYQIEIRSLQMNEEYENAKYVGRLKKNLCVFLLLIFFKRQLTTSYKNNNVLWGVKTHISKIHDNNSTRRGEGIILL